MSVSATKSGAFYGIGVYGTDQYDRASPTLQSLVSFNAGGVVNTVSVVEGTGVTFTLPSVSATGVAEDVNAYMAFTTTSVSAPLVVNADTTDFFDCFEHDVWKYVREAADAAGESVFYLLDKDIRGPTAFKNSMVWLAVEIAAQELAAQEDA